MSFKKFALGVTAVGLTSSFVFINYNNISSDYFGVYDRSNIIAVQKKKYNANNTLQYKVPSREEQLQKIQSCEINQNDEKVIKSSSNQNEPLYDIIIIGGGATGSGTALDATSRGLKVALFEKYDFASGTSSRATKLAHGGVRYLQAAVEKLDYKQLALVYECLRERKHFFQVAPHLSDEMPILTPCYSMFDSLKMYVGLRLYDIMSGKGARIGKSEWVSTKETLSLYPHLKKNGLYGSMKYYDGVFNDSRINVSVALTTAALGGLVLNHTEVCDFAKDENGTICGVKVRDRLTNKAYIVHGKVVVNATGCFSDSIRKMDDPSTPDIIKPSLGVHMIMNEKFMSTDGKSGFLFPKTSDGRVMFLVPWEKKTIVGTTDQFTDVTHEPSPEKKDVDFLIHHLEELLDTKVSSSDVDSSWAGIRPLVVDPRIASKGTAAISRDHFIDVSPSNLVTIAGGKWTSFRKMSEDAVNTVLNSPIGQKTIKPKNDSQSFNTVLVGAETINSSLQESIDLSSYKSIINEKTMDHLRHFYGDRSNYICQIAQNENLHKKLSDKYDYIEAEVVHHVRNEYARTIVDVLAYRTSLLFVDKKVAIESIPKVAELMQKELKWNNSQKNEMIQDAKRYIEKCFQ